jgi:hypothetical protein
MLKDEFFHFFLSLLVGVIIGYLFANWWAIPLALASGFLIDADHFIDYFIHNRMEYFSLQEFKSGEYFDKFGKVYVFAHGFEFAIILIIFGVFYPQLDWFFYSLGISNLLHLLYDTIYNKPIWPTYFISFRIAKKFDHKIFKFPKCQN